MRVEVNWDVCEGNAVCMGLVTEVFKVERDEKAHVLIPTPPEEMRERVQRAVEACPTRAITLRDD